MLCPNLVVPPSSPWVPESSRASFNTRALTVSSSHFCPDSHTDADEKSLVSTLCSHAPLNHVAQAKPKEPFCPVSFFLIYGVITPVTLLHMEESASVLRCIWLFVTARTVAHQAVLSKGFPRHEYWSELPFPTPDDPPDPRTELAFLASPF